jgi:opacity protein-like surface antigen
MRVITSVLAAAIAAAALATPAVAATPTHSAVVSSVMVPTAQGSPDYRRGFRAGWGSGHHQGLQDAHQFCRQQRQHRDMHAQSVPGDYDRGYADGFDRGYNGGFDSGLRFFCGGHPR